MNTCLFDYGLLDHPMLTEEVQLGGDNYLDDEHHWFEYGYGWEHYAQPHYPKLRKAKVTIEELECDPSNLASATHYVRTLADAKKVEVTAKKWTVDIWY